MSKLFGTSTYLESKRKAAWQRIEEWQGLIYSGIVFGATLVVMFWASVFLYTSFYFTYMPQESVTWPIHFKYKSCGEMPGICSNPNAVVSVTDPVHGSLLAHGQKYRVVVDVEMPESPVNQRLGMFLVRMNMMSHDQDLLRHSSRSTMLRYKSPLLQTLATAIFAPFLLYGMNEEKQMVTVELFSQYEEDPLTPLSEVHVELLTRHLELYAAQLRIHAMFTGLRYFMYHYPLSAATVGIGICMVFLSAVVILSWYQFSESSTNSQVTGKLTFPNSQVIKAPSDGSNTCDAMAPEPVVLQKHTSSLKKEEGTSAVAIQDKNPDSSIIDNTPKGDLDKNVDSCELPKEKRRDSDEFEVVNSTKIEKEEVDKSLRGLSDEVEDENFLRQRIQNIPSDEIVPDE